MTQRYVHSTLNADTTRLVVIQPPTKGKPISCYIHHTGLACDYYAVSYVCGDQSKRVPILLNDLAFDVGHNLSIFLEYASTKFANMPLWIDEICINQTDIGERNMQVQQIGEVYTKAQYVIAWLGRAGYPGSLLFQEAQLRSRLLQQSTNDTAGEVSDEYVRRLDDDRATLLASAIMHFCNLEYFNRLWVYQEFILAKDVLIVRGGHSIYASKLLPFLYDAVYAVAKTSINHPKLNSDVLYDVRRLRGGMILRHLRERTQLRGLEEILTEGFDGQCTEWRDRVFALLSLCAQRSSIPVNYNDTPEELLIKLLKVCERTGVEKALQVMLNLQRIYKNYKVKHSIRGSYLEEDLKKYYEGQYQMSFPFEKRSLVTQRKLRKGAAGSKSWAITCTYCHQTWVGSLGTPLFLFCNNRTKAGRTHAIFYSTNETSGESKVTVVERSHIFDSVSSSKFNRLPINSVLFGGTRHLGRRWVDRTRKIVTSKAVKLLLRIALYTFTSIMGVITAVVAAPFALVALPLVYLPKAVEWYKMKYT